ncbi:MAG: non-canonical purine NTP pyrophosphatase [Parvularculaceae bacterium]
MARKLAAGDLVIASHNEGKVKEINDLMSPFGVTARSAKSLGLASPEETEDTFEGNARIKALFAARAIGSPALADDSGLEVDALGGAPGVRTADWAERAPGTPRDFAFGMARLRREFAATGSVDDAARFVCCLCLAWPDDHTEAFLGDVRGRIVFPPRGDRGFGFDPVFAPAGETETFGEMDPDRKHAMSHRAAAFRQLMEACLA